MASALRAPLFLGVHSLALCERLELDAGRLAILVGAASHNDHAAHARHDGLQHGGRGVERCGDADQVFSLPGTGGSNKIGGPFLRAVLTDEMAEEGDQERCVHMWLDAGQRDHAIMELVAQSEAGVVQRLGPYRIHVLSAEVVSGVPNGDALEKPESLLVHVAIDKVQHACAQRLELEPLGESPDDQHTFWLSTQGASHVTVGSQFHAERNCDASRTEAPPSTSELPPLVCCNSLLQSQGACESMFLGGATHGGSLVELRLHTVRRRDCKDDPLSEDAGFGCAPFTWLAELDAMSLGESEEHLTLPLALTAGDCTPAPVRLGSHELRILRCVGHYARSGCELGEVVSDYPLLLLHVNIALRRLEESSPKAELGEGSSMRAHQLADAKKLGDELERLLSL